LSSPGETSSCETRYTFVEVAMDCLSAVAAATERERWREPADFLALDPAILGRDAPDAHWTLPGDAGTLRARCSLWWARTPSLLDHRVGLIGHYAAADAAAARLLLDRACRELAGRGCSVAVGPMDGSTWRRYRLVTERGSEPPFFLEPDNPYGWPEHFLACGFRPIAHYISALNDDLGREDPRVRGVAQRLRAQGVRIRPVEPRQIEDDLRRIYAVAAASFCNNVLYTPIAQAEFLAQYRAILPAVRPELVLIAEVEDRSVGFIFAVPDVTQAERGHPVDTVIVKTVAVVPDRARAGLGSLLLAVCQRTARELGYRRAIHALMHEQNVSRNLSRHYAHPMRRYALFGKALEA
jgi:GNAT superfamily N-acetyltransferase